MITINNKIKKLISLKETKFLNLYDAEYHNKKGNEKHWIIASRKNYPTLTQQFFEGKKGKVDAVVIVAYHVESKKLVFIKQFRVPLNDYVYELPAGLLDNDEKAETAVARELKEETGLSLIEINYKKSRDKVFLSPGMTDESVALVYCTCKGEISSDYLEDDENIEALLVSRSEAEELLKENANMDIKLYITLSNFVEFGEKVFL
ncbi:MAG: NUDIX hydrolase [Bacillota bacterium]|nr:NUDIX hydrolase [Bacillota bacterium]